MSIRAVIKEFEEMVVAKKEEEHKKELAAKDQRIENQIANINHLMIKNEELNNDNDDLSVEVEALTRRVEELESDNLELAQALKVIRNYDAKYFKE